MLRYQPDHPLVVQVAQEYNLRADLLSAQIQAESSGDTFACRYEHGFFLAYLKDKPSAAGAKYGPDAAISRGLLQVLLETAVEHGYDRPPWDLYIPKVGLEWGAKYLRWCLDRSGGDYRRALAAYNGAGTAAAAYATRVFAIRDAHA